MGFCPVEGLNTIYSSLFGPVDVFLLNIPPSSPPLISVLLDPKPSCYEASCLVCCGP